MPQIILGRNYYKLVLPINQLIRSASKVQFKAKRKGCHFHTYKTRKRKRLKKMDKDLSNLEEALFESLVSDE
tara:strand:- start:825 stop:1040 length:216 start_codon:yes stop_codon:yes gene_type:complete